MGAKLSRIAAIVAALGTVNACGATSRGDPGAAVRGTAGATGTDVRAPLERCYVFDDGTDRARIERDASNTYTATEGSFRTNTFDEDRQQLILSRGTTGNGERRLEVHLAADKTVADADFVECVDSSQTQFLCYRGSPVPTPVNDCSGNSVSVPDFSGCYTQSGGGFRVELSGTTPQAAGCTATKRSLVHRPRARLQRHRATRGRQDHSLSTADRRPGRVSGLVAPRRTEGDAVVLE